MKITNEKDLWLWLAQIKVLSANDGLKISRHLDLPIDLSQITEWKLKQAGITTKIVTAIIASKETFDLESHKKNLKNHAINFLIYPDQNYPALLKEIHDPPKVLFWQGTLPADWSLSIAIVGSRKMTAYGQLAAEKIIPPLAKAKFIIVSGLALGIDSEAHRLTVGHGGITVAITGSGLDKKSLYPAQNQSLANEIIASGGALISEFPPGTPPLPHHFPLRNRIIAGLTRGTLVIEASKKSGSLITAEVALNENREVLAVPGPIHTLTSQGTLKLIKEGAAMITEAADVFSVYGKTTNYQSATELISDNPLLELLKQETMHIDSIARQLNLTTSEASARLSQLEINGLIKNLGGNHYAIIN